MLSRFVLAVALSALAISPLPAARLFGTVNNNGSTLVELDPATGALIQTIGAVGFTINGLTYDSTTGTLYGSARSGGGLVTINMTTGAGTLVAGVWNTVVSGHQPVLLASNSAGQLYSWLDPSEDDLLLVNKVAGTASVVGESGIGTGTHGMAFDGSDTLYLFQSGDIYTVNTTTGAAKLVDSAGFNIAHHGDFQPSTGLYYGIDQTGGGAKNLVLINVGALSVSTLTTIDDLHTLAFIDDVRGIPEPSTWALMAAGVAMAALRRRRV
jgi:DNA-binding beta-propeller fold protein YncE